MYLAFLIALSYHLYKTPAFRMDSVQYMGNALLHQDTNIVRVHQRVYAEINRSVPRPARDYLLGHDPAAPQDQNASRELRFHDPYKFAEFLPMFAIRPLYNLAIYEFYRAGFGLLRSTVLISVVSYFVLGALLFEWAQQYSGPPLAAVLSSFTMLCPPIIALGRDNISDALATLVAFTAVYLIFEKKRLTPGLTVLLAAIYFRTDFVVLAIPVLLVCWRERRTTVAQTAVLASMAAGSVLLINYFGGDYGIRMLYYRNFVGTPLAPGEVNVAFSFHDYLSGLRIGITLAMGSFLVPFLLIGIAATARARRSRVILAVASSYCALHFVLLPNWEERWFGVFYLSMAVVAAMGLDARTRPQLLSVTQATQDAPAPEASLQLPESLPA